jgi:hypothetical protein
MGTTEKLRGLVLAALMFGSVFAMTVTVTGPVGAAVNSESFDVVEPATPSDGTITVRGNLESSGDVTFLIQDPVDDDVATVTRDVNADFSVNLDLSGLSFEGGNGQLDEGAGASISAYEGGKFGGVEATDTFDVDDTKPTGRLENPSDGDELIEHPTVSGTASDNIGVQSVALTIQRQSDHKYYDGSEFVDDETTVDAGGTTEWSYDLGSEISADGTYAVSIKVTDTAGNTKEAIVPHPDRETTEVSYTVDTTAPDISAESLNDATNDDDTISDGDTVEVTATVSDDTSGIDAVTVDASPLGGSEDATLSRTSGDQWATTIDVDGPTVGDGDVDLTVTATDKFGNPATATTNMLDLETDVAAVDSLSVENDFVGVVKDADDDVTVTASGITDPRGKEVSHETVDIAIEGVDTTFTAEVTDGTLSRTIDPTKISNTVQTGNATVSIAQADAGEATDWVELVHEAKDLHKGYQAMGTPMPAQDVVYNEFVNDVTTYDPTADGESKWATANTEQAGEGYYIDAASDNARVGYVFASNVDEGYDARTLHDAGDGWNLVGTAVDLSEETSHDVNTDLGGAVDTGSSDVQVWVRDTGEDLDQSTAESGYDNDNSAQVEGFDAYFVKIENGEEVRNVEIIGYNAANRVSIN